MVALSESPYTINSMAQEIESPTMWENLSPNEKHQDALGFTSNLLSTLAKSRSQIDEFCKNGKNKIESACDLNSETFTKEQDEINQMIIKLRDLKYQRGVASSGSFNGINESDEKKSTTIAAKKSILNDRQSLLEKELASVYTENRDKHQDLQGMKKEEEIHRIKAEEARRAKLRVEDAKQTTVEDLSLGVLKYNKLGLNFEKVADNKLRIIFTMIDPIAPRRKFSCVLSASEDEMYEILECNPPLDNIKIVPVLEHLNKTSDVSHFVRSIRREFKESLLQR